MTQNLILKKMMQNPYIWALLALCTIISLPYAIYVSIKGKIKKEFSYTSDSNYIIRNGKNTISQLKLTFDDKPIKNLTATKIAIWNSGNQVINATEMVNSKELSIQISSESNEILAAEIIASSEETNQFSLSTNPKSVKISFDYVEKNDGVVIQVLHTGPQESLTVTGKIKGGKPLKDLNNKKLSSSIISKTTFLMFQSKKIPAIVLGFVCVVGTLFCLLMIVSLFIPSLYSIVYPVVISSRESNIFAIGIISGTVVLYDFMGFIIIRDAFRLVLPSKLRKYM